MYVEIAVLVERTVQAQLPVVHESGFSLVVGHGEILE